MTLSSWAAAIGTALASFACGPREVVVAETGTDVCLYVDENSEGEYSYASGTPIPVQVEFDPHFCYDELAEPTCAVTVEGRVITISATLMHERHPCEDYDGTSEHPRTSYAFCEVPPLSKGKYEMRHAGVSEALEIPSIHYQAFCFSPVSA